MVSIIKEASDLQHLCTKRKYATSTTYARNMSSIFVYLVHGKLCLMIVIVGRNLGVDIARHISWSAREAGGSSHKHRAEESIFTCKCMGSYIIVARYVPRFSGKQ